MEGAVFMIRNKITNIEPLNKTKFLSFYKADYENKKGCKRTWMIATRKKEEEIKDIFYNNKEGKDDAVVIAAFHKDLEKLVIIKQFRIPANDFIYELPAGLIDEGESAKDSVKRELMEETGLKLVSILEDKSGEKLYLSPGMTDESVSFIYCICEGNINTEHLEDDECIEPMLIDRKEAEEILRSNKKIDIKCFLILQNFVIFGDKIFK